MKYFYFKLANNNLNSKFQPTCGQKLHHAWNLLFINKTNKLKY
jgi:hypothetical protein